MVDETTSNERQDGAQPQEPAPSVPPAPPETTPATQSVGASAPTPPRRSRRIWIIVGLLLLIILGGTGGWYAYSVAQARSAAQEKVEEATTLIENADMVVLDVDEVVRAEVTEEIGDQAAELQERVPDAAADLIEASAVLEEAIPEVPEDDVARARALKVSADTRADMLSTVDPILEANIKAAASLQPSLDGWAAVLEGETLADQAVAEYNKLTEEAVKKSQTLTDEAEEKYGDAEHLFSVATTGFPEADFSAYMTYIDGKKELLEISRKADEAFLAGDKAKANELGDQYNDKDKALVELAKKLPDTPAEIVANAYEELAGDATTAYFEARDRATEADKALKDLEELSD